MTFVSNHHFPRHSHEQFSIGVIAFGAQRSWSGVAVRADAGDIIMANPGEIHDGPPVGDGARGWRVICLDPVIMAREAREEFVGSAEIVRPVAHDPFAGAVLRRAVYVLYGRSAGSTSMRSFRRSETRL